MTDDAVFRDLPVPLTDEELKVRADQLATKVKEKRQIETEKKAANDGFKTRIESADNAVQDLSTVVKERREYRPVECEWVENRQLFTMELVRKDTRQRVDSRPMSYDERQGSLNFDSGHGARFDKLEVDVDDDEKPAPKKRGKKSKPVPSVDARE